jgi:hypothetical protein
MIISLHIPKTAGSSFREALQQHFGERLLLDYADKPLQVLAAGPTSPSLIADPVAAASLRGIDCVHGHFFLSKYLELCNALPIKLVTWLRDPIQRVCSHYYYWKQDPGDQPVTDLRRRMLAEDWDLGTFALCPELRDICVRFMCHAPPEAFAFLGLTEFYEEDLEDFSRHILQAPLKYFRLNDGPRRSSQSYELPAGLRQEIEAFHAKDMALYRRALELRQKRIAAAGFG